MLLDSPANSTAGVNVWVKGFFCLILLYLSFYLLFTPQPFTFLDYANLLIHEGGHMLFSLFGQFLYVLGGSLFQCLVPVILGCYFLITRQLFASAFCLFWFGDNLINVSVYIRDASAKHLPLLFGDIHDWNWILSHLNLLSMDQIIGTTVFIMGSLFLVCGLIACIGLVAWEIQR